MPELLVWEERYCIDDGEIDQQHRSLFAMANELAQMETPVEPEALKQILHRLVAHMETHFQCEEELFQIVKFPDYERHVQEHRDCIRQVNEMVLNAENLDGLFHRLARFVGDWGRQHILEEDMRYADFLRPLLELRKQKKAEEAAEVKEAQPAVQGGI
jgi:hemerythrin